MDRINNFTALRTGECAEEPKEEAYSEYQTIQIEKALNSGMRLYEIGITLHPECSERSVASLMIEQRLQSAGHVLFTTPDLTGGEVEDLHAVKAVIGSDSAVNKIRETLSIAGIVEGVDIRPYIHKTNDLSPGTRNYSQMKNEILRIEASKVDRIMNLVGELIISRSIIEQITKNSDRGISEEDLARLSAVNSFMERTVSDLQKGTMKMRMVPINHVFRKFPKVVRELAAERGKMVRIDIYGRETELDKGIVDALGEPLVHIIRNSIDHGIEDMTLRKSANKPEEGLITLRAYHEAGHIVVEVADDGMGIDIDMLRKRAADNGFLHQDEAETISDREAVNLLFLSGLSTSETVTDISGRGVGMDAVRSAVEEMKGSIDVETSKGVGTKFIIRLPLTLAVIKALLVKAHGRVYAIPISAITEVTRIMTDEMTTVDGMDTLLLRNRTISLIHLDRLFRLNGDNVIKKKFALILEIGDKTVGLVVDELAGQQELVIKSIDRDASDSGLLAGASILGDGKVVLIIDTSAIFRKAVEEESGRMAGV
jgi:two-component system chemotaxis sensor kinase CheA